MTEKFIKYRCGLRPGDLITLRKTLYRREMNGRFVAARRFQPGELWTVLVPCKTDLILTLLDPSNRQHFWEDDPADVRKWFRLVRPAKLRGRRKNRE